QAANCRRGSGSAGAIEAPPPALAGAAEAASFWLPLLPSQGERSKQKLAASAAPANTSFVAYQCTPRISEAKAICSPLGSASPLSAFLSPLAAAESGNSSNAVFITTSYAFG